MVENHRPGITEEVATVNLHATHPCPTCAQIWRSANASRQLHLLQLLELGSPPLPQGTATRHLLRDHGIGSSEFLSLGAVWLCGILSGLAFSPGTSGVTFEDKVTNEIQYRRRLHRQTLAYAREGGRSLRANGILTDDGIRAGAVRLSASWSNDVIQVEPEPALVELVVGWAFREACASVKPQ